MTSVTRSRDDHDRLHRAVRAFRAGLARAIAAPATALIYTVGTIGSPGRPAMAAIAAAMLVLLGIMWAAARPIVVSRHRFAIQAAAVVAVIASMSALLLLDDGVASPLGALAVYALLFFGATVPTRLFVMVSGLGALAYAGVALLGDAPPPGYAPTMMIGAVGIGYLCRRYASALSRIKRRLTELSIIDPLTGCLNRRGFDERLEHELAQATRTGDKVTLVLLDLDRFKDVNDSFGHAAGDRMLACTGSSLVGTVRAHDSVGRIGGDEFAVLLVNTAADAASTAVERLRAGVGEMAPASYGFAVYPDDGTTAVELSERADERLYEDKARHGGSPRRPTIEMIESTRVGGDEIPRPPTEARSRRIDRLRHTVLDFGVLCTFCHLTGLLYILVLAGDRPNRMVTAVALAVGAGCGVVSITCADRIARSRWAGPIMTALAVPEFASAAVAVVLDGGVFSPMSFGLVAPLPMVAYGSPPKRAAPIVGGVLVGYAAIGLVCGGVSVWYVGMYIGGSLALVFACGQMGREAARQRRRLNELSRADVMTGALNRRGFEERFEAELAHAHRGEQPMALVLFDLDGFKQVNDTQGHAAGDELLIWVAATLVGALHPHDLVARLGGDEFAVVLTARLPEPEDEVIARLRTALGERTAVSIGAARLGIDGDTFDELYASADKRLYTEKRGGPQPPSRPLPVEPTRPAAVTAADLV
jgi:diguanylate cyclase (GGDEF)-like protein